jgi:hypothetical protein
MPLRGRPKWRPGTARYECEARATPGTRRSAPGRAHVIARPRPAPWEGRRESSPTFLPPVRAQRAFKAPNARQAARRSVARTRRRGARRTLERAVLHLCAHVIDTRCAVWATARGENRSSASPSVRVTSIPRHACRADTPTLPRLSDMKQGRGPYPSEGLSPSMVSTACPTERSRGSLGCAVKCSSRDEKYNFP